jgi:hypothetical protein
MAESEEMRNQTGVCTLVEQEPHAEARVTPPATPASSCSRCTA